MKSKCARCGEKNLTGGLMIDVAEQIEVDEKGNLDGCYFAGATGWLFCSALCLTSWVRRHQAALGRAARLAKRKNP